MLLQVVIEGRGTEEDPYRAPLPTWTLRHIDYQLGVAVVDVPEGVYPSQPGWDTKIVRTEDGRQFPVLVPPAKAVQEWEAREGDLYPEHAARRRLRDVLVR